MTSEASNCQDQPIPILFDQAIEQSASAVLVANLDGVICYVNPAFSKISGYSSDEVLGQKTSIVQSGKTPLRTYKDLWSTINSGEPWRGEILNTKKTGELYWQTITISPIKNNIGKVTHYFAIEEDITTRKHYESKQRELVDKLSALLREIKTLRGLLPICSACKKIRDASGNWHQLETYIENNSEAEFTHGICQTCTSKLYPQYDHRKKIYAG